MWIIDACVTPANLSQNHLKGNKNATRTCKTEKRTYVEGELPRKQPHSTAAARAVHKQPATLTVHFYFPGNILIIRRHRSE